MMAYASEATAERASASTISTAVAELESIVQRLCIVRERASTFADRIGGMAPTPVDNPKLDPGSNCILQDLNRKRRSINDIIDQIETQLNRIDQSL